MSSAVKQEVSKENWKRAFIGLPPDFLRLSSRDVQESSDRQVAFALQQQAYAPALNISGRLSITIAQAKLVKNYGLTRMDPYVRLRVGHFVYETQTDNNGGKNPRWNRVFHAQLPKGVSNISIEIYDECNFSMDEIIAWADIRIPEVVLNGETHEDWYPLSGKSGDGREGMIDLVLTFTPMSNCVYPVNYQQPVMMVPNVSANRGLPVFVTPQVAPVVVAQPPVVPQTQPQPGVPQQIPTVQPPQTASPQHVPQLTDSDISQLQEMFPNLDKEVIKSIGEANRGNREATINSLLQINN
jgi:toll-interacting protein